MARRSWDGRRGAQREPPAGCGCSLPWGDHSEGEGPEPPLLDEPHGDIMFHATTIVQELLFHIGRKFKSSPLQFGLLGGNIQRRELTAEVLSTCWKSWKGVAFEQGWRWEVSLLHNHLYMAWPWLLPYRDFLGTKLKIFMKWSSLVPHHSFIHSFSQSSVHFC